MRTYEEAFAAAKDEWPFSNGTEGEAWLENWCERCVNDSPEMVDAGNGCPLILVSLIGRTPVEWTEQDSGDLGDTYHCTEFRDEDDKPPRPPRPYKPPPENPNQITIFEVFVDQAVEQFQTEPAVAP